MGTENILSPSPPSGEGEKKETRLKKTQGVIPREQSYKMRNRIFLILGTAVLELLMCGSLVFAQNTREIYQIDITCDTSVLHITPCPLPGISGDTWRFINFTSDSLQLRIPICVGKKQFNIYTLASGDSVDHVIGMWDAGLLVLLVKLGDNKEIAYCDRVHPPQCSTLGQWGIIALVALLISSAVFIMQRRRRATVPA